MAVVGYGAHRGREGTSGRGRGRQRAGALALFGLVVGQVLAPPPARAAHGDRDRAPSTCAGDGSAAEAASPAESASSEAPGLALGLSAGIAAGSSSAGLREGAGLDGWAVWSTGDLLFFVGASPLLTRQAGEPDEPEPVSTTVYGELHVRWSLGRLLCGRRLGSGLIRDLVLAQELDFGSGGMAHLHGIGLDLASGSARTNLYLRDDPSEPGVTWQLLVGLSTTVALGSEVGVSVFVDVIGAEGESDGGFYVYAQALAEAGGLIGVAPDRLGAGITSSLAGRHLAQAAGTLGVLIRWGL